MRRSNSLKLFLCFCFLLHQFGIVFQTLIKFTQNIPSYNPYINSQIYEVRIFGQYLAACSLADEVFGLLDLNLYSAICNLWLSETWNKCWAILVNENIIHKGSLDLFDAISGPWNCPNMSVSGASMTQKGSALFQAPESFKKVQFHAQEIFNFCLILEFDVKLLRLM